MRAVQRTADLRRVAALPKRDWQESVDLADALTAHLTREHVCHPGCALLNGVQVLKLRPVQAAALAELHDHGGLFLQARVGAGKTLISMVAGALIEADRVLLVTKAGIKPQTQNDQRVLKGHWKMSPMSTVTYEFLSRANAVSYLHHFFANAQRPLLILDEGQKVKDPKAACTRRIKRFVREWRKEGKPHLYYLDMSGTPAKRSIRDISHRLEWARQAQSPLPIVESDLIDWANCVDEKVQEQNQMSPGALLSLCDDADLNDLDELTAARRAVGRRIFETPGVIGTTDAGIPTPLNVTLRELRISTATDEAFRHLRGDPKEPQKFPGWRTPDGHPIADAVALWRHAREVALGLFYRWEPRAPTDWLRARGEWCAAVRDILTHNQRELDTEFQVADEVRRAIHGRRCPVCKRRTIAHRCDGEDSHDSTETTPDPQYHKAADVYEAWHVVKDTFIPNTVPVWIGDDALNYATKWASEGPGIIWTEHSAFAKELSRRTGLAYYGQKGQDRHGRSIGQADPKTAIIASIAANGTGRNLQAWHRALTTSCGPTGIIWEQKLGRLHRDGQQASSVDWDVLIACREQLAGFEQVQNDCQFHKDLLLSPAKLTFANIRREPMAERGWAWASQRKPTKEDLRDALEALRPTG